MKCTVRARDRASGKVIAEQTAEIADMDDFPGITRITNAVRHDANEAKIRAGGKLDYNVETPEFS